MAFSFCFPPHQESLESEVVEEEEEDERRLPLLDLDLRDFLSFRSLEDLSFFFLPLEVDLDADLVRRGGRSFFLLPFFVA